MTALLEPRFWLVLAASAAATVALARLARRLGWGDGAVGAERGRKEQARPVPPVGGAALLLGLVLVPLELPAGTWAALLLCFLVGLVDDLQPLRPVVKLGLQALALFPHALALLAAGHPVAALAGFLLGLLALNVGNTFDNADGALGSVAALGLACAHPLALAALLGFLPFNLDAGRVAQVGRGPWRPS